MSKVEIKETPVIRSPFLKEGDDFLKVYYTGKTTIPETVEHTCKKFKNRNGYFFRRVVKEHIEKDLKTSKELITYEFGKVEKLTYGQMLKIFRSMASGMLRYDPSLKKGSKIGIYMETCKEWQVANQAAQINAITVVTCYANLGIDALIHIINECELTCMVTVARNVKMMEEKGIYEKCPTLKKLITVGKNTYKPKFFETKDIFDVILDGEKNPQESFEKCSKDDVALIMYTSGTTGNPKGVMLTHENIVADATCCWEALYVTDKDVHCAYLPSAHIFEYVLHLTFLFTGCEIGFATPRTLMAKPGGAKYKGDLSIIRPTILCGVPRVWETIKKAVLSGVNNAPFVNQYLFNSVYARKLSYLKQGQDVDVFLDNVVFKKPRLLFGGRLRIIVSGGAPLSSECQYFFQACLGPKGNIVQGYGLTETAAAALVQPTQHWSRVDSVGSPVSVNDIKLVDVPDLNYLTTNTPPTGEVCMKGTNIAKGYYKNPEKTKEVFDEDGWFHSGDIGRINKDGSLSIIDRKKNLVKLSGGEYIALELLEMIYATSIFFQPNGICVYVNPEKAFPVAVCVIDPVYCTKWAKENKIKGNLVDIAKSPILKKAILKSLAEIAEKYKKAKFEHIKDIAIFNDMWVPQNGMTTASMKLKRRAIYEKYDESLKEMYGEKKKEEVVETVEKKDDIPVYFKLMSPDF